LLEEIQEKRKREEERFLDDYEASLRRHPSDAPRGGRHGANLTRSAGPASPGPACRPEGRRYPQNETPRGGRQASNRKKILNRGNEPKTLLKTQELTGTASSKRTPFCPGKSAIEAKKGGVSTQETAGTAHASAAHRRAPARAGAAQARLKIGGKAALPPDLRKASGFPAQIASLLPPGSAGRRSLPAEPRRLVRAEALGKAKPFRKSGGRAALRGYPSGTLTRPCGKADAIFGTAVRSSMARESRRPKQQVCATASPRSALGCVIVNKTGFRSQEKSKEHGVASGDGRKARGGLRHSCCHGGRARPPG
jgi:hypothetical protein